VGWFTEKVPYMMVWWCVEFSLALWWRPGRVYWSS